MFSLRFCNVFSFYLLAYETSATGRGTGVTRDRHRHRTWTKGMNAKETNSVHAAESAQSFPPVESLRLTHQPTQVSSRTENGTLQ